MRKELIISIILVIVAIVFVGFFILGDFLNQYQDKKDNDLNESSEETSQDEKQEEKQNETSLTNNKQRCVELGCEEGSVYIGSVNSDKYYECTCHYAERIHPENIICFKTKAEAESDDRVLSEC